MLHEVGHAREAQWRHVEAFALSELTQAETRRPKRVINPIRVIARIRMLINRLHSLVLALIWINRKGSGSSVMLGKWRAGETPLPTGWQALDMQRSRFAIVLEVITAAAVVVLVLYVLLGPHN
jgi:hypothetical protein